MQRETSKINSKKKNPLNLLVKMGISEVLSDKNSKQNQYTWLINPEIVLET